jgi:hypothetical protein
MQFFIFYGGLGMETDFILDQDSKDKDLSLGNVSFDNMISNGHIYVDKTELIYDLLKPNFGIYFLARPRRFGKSLLLDTIRCIFEGKRYLFKGLAIENKTPKYGWDICRVIYIDMSQIRTKPDQLDESLTKRLYNIAKSYGVTLTEQSSGVAFSELVEALYALPHTTLPYTTDKSRTNVEHIQFSQRPVLLIDEYDCPLTKYISQPEMLAINREILQDFYLNVKACSRLIRFGLSQESLYSKNCLYFHQ